MKVLQLCCPQKTHFLSGRVQGRNKGEKPQTQYMHCHLLVDREPRPALPCWLPLCYSTFRHCRTMAVPGKGPRCTLIQCCMLKAEEHRYRWGLLKPRTKFPSLWWDLCPSQCWPSTFMVPLSSSSVAGMVNQVELQTFQ